jgi:hypothetical protein
MKIVWGHVHKMRTTGIQQSNRGILSVYGAVGVTTLLRGCQYPECTHVDSVAVQGQWTMAEIAEAENLGHLIDTDGVAAGIIGPVESEVSDGAPAEAGEPG